MSPTTKTAKKTHVRADQREHDRLRAENARLRKELKKRPKLLEDTDPDLPPLPPADANGQYPAIETARVIIARQVIRGRKAARLDAGRACRQRRRSPGDNQPH